MKMLKLFGLAVVSALGMMAFVGAGSASADTLCKENVSPCPAGKAYPAGTEAKAKLPVGAKAFLKGVFPVECLASTSSAVLSEETGNPVLNGVINGLTFNECTLGTNNCVVEVKSLNYHAAINATGGGDGTLTVTAGEGEGNPGARITCGALVCEFRAKSVTLDIEGGQPAVLVAEEEPLELVEGPALLCGAEAGWNAEYEINQAIEPGGAPVNNPPGFVSVEP